MTSRGGRPPQISVDDIRRVGRELGLRRLSMGAVAHELGVSTTALYRHVDNRWELERLVGEDILGELHLLNDDSLDLQQHLLSLAMQLFEFTANHPGLASYIQTLFPRGDNGRRLLAEAAHSLKRYGYAPDLAIVLATSISTLAIGYAAAMDDRRVHADELDEKRTEALTEAMADSTVAEAFSSLPAVDDVEYVRLWLAAAIDGFVRAAPAHMSTREVLDTMRASANGMTQPSHDDES